MVEFLWQPQIIVQETWLLENPADSRIFYFLFFIFSGLVVSPSCLLHRMLPQIALFLAEILDRPMDFFNVVSNWMWFHPLLDCDLKAGGCWIPSSPKVHPNLSHCWRIALYIVQMSPLQSMDGLDSWVTSQVVGVKRLWGWLWVDAKLDLDKPSDVVC